MPASSSVVVIGCGSIGRRHIANLRRLGVEEIIAFDPDPARVAEAADEHSVIPVMTLADAYAAGPNAAFVCSPTSHHLEHTRGALAHGCHVFVEKPLATGLEGVDELADAAARAGLQLMVGYNLRFNPCLRQVKAWLEEGLVGSVVSARLHFGSYLPWRHAWEDYRVGYGARRDLGGGVILDAIHELDYALWLFGAPTRAYCIAGTFSDLEIDTEDVAEILLSYEGPPVVGIHLDYVQRPHERWCEVIGDRGRIRCDLVARTTAVSEGEHPDWVAGLGGGDANDDYLAEIEHFLACVSGAAQPLVDAAEARRSLELALACKRSAESGAPVVLSSRVES